MLIRRRRASVRSFALLLGVAVALVGCKARAGVAVFVEPDGSGTVTLSVSFDDDAIARLGGDLDAAIRLDDVRAAGWEVEGPAKSGPMTSIVLTKPFADASRLGAVLAELGGADGPFAGWKLTTSNAFTASTYELTGKVRLTGSLDQFSDSEVAAALDGFALGRSPEELKAALDADPDALTLSFTATLPGEMDEVSGLDRDGGGAHAATEFRLGDGAAVDRSVSVTSRSTDRSAVLWIIVGVGLVVAAVLLFVAGARARRRRARRRPAGTVPASDVLRS